MQNKFADGIRDGIPIALGYFSVSFAFGMTALTQGVPLWAAVAISFTCLTSAGHCLPAATTGSAFVTWSG